MEQKKVNIDGKEYDLDKLSDDAKNNLRSIRATDIEIARQDAMLSMLKTARSAYARALKKLVQD